MNMVVEVVGMVASDLLIAYAWTRLLHMRSNLIFWLLLLPFMAFAISVRNVVGAEFRLLLLLVGYGLLPFFLSVDRPSRRLLAIALVNVAVVVAEAASISGWYLMTGLDIMGQHEAAGHTGAFALTHVIHLVVLVVLFVALRIAFTRIDCEKTRGLRSFVLFPVVQAAMLVLLLAAGIYLRQGSNVLYFGAAALSLVCLVADVALFFSMDRYTRKRREDQRATLLQRQLDDYLVRCNAFVVEVERSAKFRHDVRNQAHTAITLAGQGEFSRARAHLAEFRRDCIALHPGETVSFLSHRAMRS